MRATRNDLTEEVKRKVIKALQERVCLGKLPRGTMQAMATEFELDRGTIRELWRRFQQGCLKSRKYGHTGPTTRYTAEVVIAKIQEIPRIQRSNMRDISEASDISISTISRALKKGIIKHRSSRLKPLLTEENMRERLQYCGAHVMLTQEAIDAHHAEDIGPAGEASDAPAMARSQREIEFCGMWDVVHLDEKWFNADKDCRKVYLVEGEEVEHRVAKSKRFIAKVMFLCAVARPREGFDGKVDMWPFVVQAAAVRSSRNRPAGTIVTTLINVDARTYHDYVINKVVPAIKATFPSVSKRIVLQQDNATPHRSINDESLAKVSTDGWTFVIRQQPPNSPDLNVLDLGFFASIQSLQYKMVSRSVDDVIASTMVAFETLGEEKLSDVFLTLQAVMRLVLEHHGGNGFKLPHLHKDTMKRAGTLMENVSCPVSVLFAAHRFLQQ